MKKIIIMLLLVLLIPVVGAGSELPWYDIEDWEVKVCSRWGGRGRVINAIEQNAPIYQSQLTLTVQGRRTELVDEYLYQVGYYINPLQSPVDFSVDVFDQRRRKERLNLDARTVEPGGYSFYQAFVSTETYTHIHVVISGRRLVFPIIIE